MGLNLLGFFWTFLFIARVTETILGPMRDFESPLTVVVVEVLRLPVDCALIVLILPLNDIQKFLLFHIFVEVEGDFRRDVQLCVDFWLLKLTFEIVVTKSHSMLDLKCLKVHKSDIDAILALRDQKLDFTQAFIDNFKGFQVRKLLP